MQTLEQLIWLIHLFMEDLLWKFCNSSPMLLCRVTKFPSLNFQCLFLREKILLLVSPISLIRFQFLTFVRESKGLFWIFDMSTSLYTSRSLIRNYSLFKFYLKPATLWFSQTTENFSLSLRILAMGFQNIFSSVCPFSGSLQLHIFLHQFWSHYRNRGGVRASLWLFPWWQFRRGNTMFLKVNSLVVHSDMFMSGFFPNEKKSL